MAAIQRLSPVLTQVILQGIKEGLFITPYPQECIEMFLTISQFLFDESLFGWNQYEYKRHLQALLYLMETSLQAKEDALAFLRTSLLEEN